MLIWLFHVIYLLCVSCMYHISRFVSRIWPNISGMPNLFFWKSNLHYKVLILFCWFSIFLYFWHYSLRHYMFSPFTTISNVLVLMNWRVHWRTYPAKQYPMGHVNIWDLFFCWGNSQRYLYDTQSKSDWLFDTQYYKLIDRVDILE